MLARQRGKVAGAKRQSLDCIMRRPPLTTWRQSSATSRETGLMARCTTLPPAGPATRLHPYTYTKRTVVGRATREVSVQPPLRSDR
jgi:hypothetical protein